MDIENRPDMDIPIGLTSSPKRDEENMSETSSDLIVGEYVPPAPVRQCTCSPQTCPCCGSLERNQFQLIVHISQFHPNYVYPCRNCSKTFFTHNSRSGSLERNQSQLIVHISQFHHSGSRTMCTLAETVLKHSLRTILTTNTRQNTTPQTSTVVFARKHSTSWVS